MGPPLGFSGIFLGLKGRGQYYALAAEGFSYGPLSCLSFPDPDLSQRLAEPLPSLPSSLLPPSLLLSPPFSVQFPGPAGSSFLPPSWEPQSRRVKGAVLALGTQLEDEQEVV